ncbi:MAG: winged helix-turn-helix domain-containing protein [Vitreoscilla sp.]|nr:winged helix-turn-helix domain-containing protein [Vitreoscilla sp.]
MDLDATVALITEDEPRARLGLQAAWNEATALGDTAAAWRVSGLMLLAINLDFIDFRGVARWCDRFAAGVSGGALADDLPRARAGERAALRACAACLVWPSLDHAASAGNAPLRDASQALAEGLRAGPALPPGERFLLAKCLLDYHDQQMEALAVARLIALQQEHLQSEPPSPSVRSRWWFLVRGHHERLGEADAAQQARVRLQELADAHDIPELRYALLTQDMPVALKARQLGRAERIHRELEALMPDMRAGCLPQGLHAQASYLSQRGDCTAALARIERLLAICGDLEVPERDQGAYRVLRANVLTGLGRFDEALAELQRLHQHQFAAQGEVVTMLRQLTEAAARLDIQPAAALERLADGLANAARLQSSRFFLTLPDLAARLCQVALDAGIEPEFVRATIRDRHLTPPDPTRADWPWRVRVQVLGELTISRDDQPLRSAGKAQRKPLELLALLAAHGGGPVDADFIIDALWPSLEADAPKASLEMAVSRLRKLLDLPEAVAVVDGAVSLDPTLVWCDATSFEALAEQLQSSLAEHQPEAQLARTAERAFSLYRDRLLGSEELVGPMRLARERLALCFYRAVTSWGGALEARGQWRAAIVLYERALTREVLAEPIYRALMRAQLACGERAEALRTFRRCRELLATVLGTAPAAETLALFHEASA